MEWLAPFRLPEPSIGGTKATYADVQPGVDLELDARRNGFEVDLVVKERPESSPVWRFPMRTKGLTARTAKSGVIEFVDAKNVVRSRIPVAYMWDAASNPVTGEPANKTVVNVSVEQVSPGKATLVVAPDATWFMDPARVFPVTVDPTYVAGTASPSFDTFVQTSVGTDLSSTTDLRVGKNGTHQERTFFNFGTGPFQGKDIVSATLSLYQDGATTCTPTAVNLYGAGVASGSTTWANQPTISTTLSGTASFAKGFSASCAAGRVGIPMTSLAQYWSTTQAGTVGVALKAASESEASHWKRFRSMESSTDPFVSFTWNRKPNAPATVEPSEAVAYAAPGETTSSLYSPGLRPWVRTKATDPDGNTVKYIFEFYTGSGSTLSVKGTCTSSVYASGTTAGCRPATDLPDNTLLYIRAKANDGRLDGPWVSYNQRLRTAAATPVQPEISCPAPYGNNTWRDTAPTADVKCTITATGTGYNAPGYLRVIVDGKRPPASPAGGAEGQIKITPSSDPAVAKWDVTFPKDKAGLHTIVTQAETPSGRLSTPNKTHSFGWGGTSLTSPTVNPRITTADDIRITAAGPPKGTSSIVEARVKWRVSGYGGTDDLVGWNEDTTPLPVTDNGAGGVTVNTLWDTNKAESDAHLDFNPETPAIEPTPLNKRVPVKLDVQVCFKYGSTEQCTWSQTPDTTVQRVPHAFGNGFPTAEAGPGQVALATGEFNTSATDVTVPGYTGDLSISRSHSTYAGPANVMNGVFGPGWVANFDGADAGAAGVEVVDSTPIDGTIALLSGDGSGLTFESPTGQRRSGATFEVGKWVPADEDTELAGSKLTITGAGTSLVVSLTDEDGTVTTWTPSAAPTASTPTLFRAAGIAEPGIAAKTVFSYDGAGRVTRILAPAPPGVTCPATGVLNPGCRALRFVYATIGDSHVRLSEAWLEIYNPDKTGPNKMDSVQVAAYTFDANALLIKVTDPRNNLSTEYTYNAANHLTSIKPAGLLPFQLAYTTADQRAKLDAVTRDRPAGDTTGGTATLGKFVYDVPLSGPGLPDLSQGSVARWNQKSAPTNGYAVFGPDRPVTGAPSTDDWQYADLYYTDAAGYTVNTAEHGAGQWQHTSVDYDDQGNIVRELDQRALRAVIDGALPSGASVDQLATLTVYNRDIKNAAGDTVLTPAGSLVTDTYGPARYAVLKDGTVRWARSHTHTTYDNGAPNGGINPATQAPYRLETSEIGSVFDPGTGQDIEPIAGSVTDYTATGSGEPDGWALGLETRSVTDIDLDGTVSAGDHVHLTRYDAEGRPIEARRAKSAAGNGTDAGTTKTAYYSVTANTTFPECGGKPQWAGLPCKSYPGGVPASAAGQPATPPLPTTTTAAYNYLLVPTTVIETSGSVTRTTAITYLLDGRVKSNATSTTGLPEPVPATNKDTTYAQSTGLATVATALNPDGTTAATSTTTYDDWGRAVSYQPAGEQTTTTTYNAVGEVAKIIDSNATTSYTYSGTDAAGTLETRRLITKVEVAAAGGTWTSTAAHDSAGDMTVQKLPGGITQTTGYDTAGFVTGLEYSGLVTTTSSDGTTSTDPNGKWLGWSRDSDVNGRLAHEWTPDGLAFTGPAGSGSGGIGDALPYDRAYSYDAAGRLHQVKDRTGLPGADILDPAQAACVTRTYGFDANDNRLTKATATSDATGVCTADGATVVPRSFDTADRPTSGANGQGAYSYDPLGRTLTIPAADTPRPADGDIALTYFDNDLPKSITQGQTTTSYTLDALDRRATETTTTAGTSVTLLRHYTGPGSDNPTWVTQGSAIRRYAELIGEDLSLTVDQNGAGQLTLANTHGDIVTTVELPSANTSATAITGWNNYDEYGTISPDNTAITGPVRYGWLGASQRATSGADLILMGARLYNSATGLFTSADPIPEGNTNQYTYPTDPVNQDDLDGRICRCGGGRLSGMVGGRVGGSTGSSTRGYGRSNGRGSRPAASPSGGHRYSLKHHQRVMDRLERINRSSQARARGKKGMEKAGVKTQNTKRITYNGRQYVPDHWKGNRAIEVKYYRPGRTLYATRQIRGMAWGMKQAGGRLVIRVNRGVKLSSGIRTLIRDAGVIISRF